MSSMATGWIIFACFSGGTLLGMLLRAVLPEHHLSSDSKDTLKLGLGLIGTMGALVLGLMVGSAKSSYDTQKGEVAQMAAKIGLLDRALAHYGPETKESRDLLRRTVAGMIDQMWPEDRSQSVQMPTAAGGEALYDRVQQLVPKSDAQRSLQSQAQSMAIDVGQTRWLLFEQAGSSISTPFQIVLVFWLTIVFMGFGLFAPPNSTVLAALLLCALSVSGAIYLIMELDRPFDGLIQISSDPFRNTLAQLGK